MVDCCLLGVVGPSRRASGGCYGDAGSGGYYGDAGSGGYYRDAGSGGCHDLCMERKSTTLVEPSIIAVVHCTASTSLTAPESVDLLRSYHTSL